MEEIGLNFVLIGLRSVALRSASIIASYQVNFQFLLTVSKIRCFAEGSLCGYPPVIVHELLSAFSSNLKR